MVEDMLQGIYRNDFDKKNGGTKDEDEFKKRRKRKEKRRKKLLSMLLFCSQQTEHTFILLTPHQLSLQFFPTNSAFIDVLNCLFL